MINKTKQGFTIIEVVLVLAIVGSIFLMVFVALPQLQRNQRDTQRRNDVAKVVTAVNQYKTNNRGKVFKGIDYASCPSSTSKSINPSSYSGSNQACKFIAKYLNSSSSSENEFVDPDGTSYGLIIYNDGYSWDFADSMNFQDHDIVIDVGVVCDGSSQTTEANPYSFAVYIILEGSGTYCADNQ